ncbi:uncharacterized protein LOC109827099 isoform X2 [Asparagus officinalis]|uniref:uncharacterized protein LOC109827099 isoform X2 n=1 Tax=Asparagus officinalis TaxID=4686 RepID=UPI00098E6F85|nr:uncharacterized protein LOC109827099 isoform X2 [Asparagus officinalis]XP_020249651.1 uncharacterized protein LOC109827099 isoform X2 [Asparagus officinalis]
MISPSNWVRYAFNKLNYSASLDFRKYKVGQINADEWIDATLKNFFQVKLTFLHWIKGGEEMAPIITSEGGSLLVRKMAALPPTKQVFVGDVVMLKDPEKPDDYLLRRLAAIEGYEMVSKDEKDEPFVLEKDQCWVLSDNKALKAKAAVTMLAGFSCDLFSEREHPMELCQYVG